MRLRSLGGLLGLTLLGLSGCQEGPKAGPAKKADPPAKVEKVPGEADLTTIHVTAEAEGRLGVATAKVERRKVGRTRTYGGEVMVPPGRSVTVSAPLSGTVMVPDGGRVPQPGDEVRKGQEVLRLLPLISPEARTQLSITMVETEGQVDQAETALAQSRNLLERQEELFRQKIGGSGALKDARANYQIAEATLNAAKKRSEALKKTLSGIDAGNLEPLALHADSEGLVKTVHVQPGQSVAVGAMLFDVESLDPVWVRVPVYVGDRRLIDLAADALVGELDDRSDHVPQSAKAVVAPPSGDPIAATVHLYYEAPNPAGTLWPGQRVGVRLPLAGETERLIVPRSAVLHDIHGGTWVYQKAADLTYQRVRVRIDHLAGNEAVLRDGPPAETLVVTDGAAELFGTEFGGAK